MRHQSGKAGAFLCGKGCFSMYPVSEAFLQFGLEETREQLCRNILADISVVRYVPFDSSAIGNPALDLGDVLTFRGGRGADRLHHLSNCKIGGKHTLKCVGKNPRVAQAKSKNDKNISGLLNQIEAGRSAYTLLPTPPQRILLAAEPMLHSSTLNLIKRLWVQKITIATLKNRLSLKVTLQNVKPDEIWCERTAANHRLLLD